MISVLQLHKNSVLFSNWFT